MGLESSRERREVRKGEGKNGERDRDDHGESTHGYVVPWLGHRGCGLWRQVM